MSQQTEMPMRTLGRTGVKVSLVGLGGWHLGFDYIDEDLSIRMIGTPSITASTLWTTAGTIAMASVRSAWARLYAMATASECWE